MPRTFTVQETIQRPPNEVWTFLTDWENAHKWMPGVEGIESAGDTATGTVLTFRARGKTRTSTIVQCEIGGSIVLRSEQGGVVADYSYLLHDLGDGSTRVTLVADCQFSGLWWNVMSPLIRLAVRMSDAKQLRLLRAAIEGS